MPFLSVWNAAQHVLGSQKKRNMANKQSFGLPLGVVLAFSLGVAAAQAPVYNVADKDLSVGAAASRLAGDWHSSAAVTISSAPPALPAGATDLGRAPSAIRLERLLLLLEPSAAQQQALITELAHQQNSTSPDYHHWLTAAAFAEAYGNSATDVAAVSAWLGSQGFQVAALPAGRGWIEFSGTAAQVEQAFHSQVHLIALAGGGTRAVLAGSVSVPAALEPVVHGLVSLDGALSTAALTTPRPVLTSVADLAGATSPSQAEALTPRLAAQLLHLDALHAAGLEGAGETIAIPARSNVAGADIAAFRSAFSLPVSPLVVHLAGADPGVNADQAEAVLAASWAGAAAPGARIVLVPAATTNSTDGLDLTLAAIVDQALGQTVPVGYSACEAALSESHQAFYAALYQQAAAEGMAVIAAAGDSGAAACQAVGSDTPVTSGYGVNALASTPWNTAVGVAAFGSEGPASGFSSLTAWAPGSTADPAYASGGGRSMVYAAPSWQPVLDKTVATSESSTAKAAAATQIAAGSLSAQELFAAGLGTGHRLLPDLVLPTAIDTGVNRGLAFCLSGVKTGTAGSETAATEGAAGVSAGSTAAGGCTLVRAGGSSGSAAIFSGIAAVVAQKYGAQGNLAPHLYALSQLSGIFSDVEQGSAQLRCVTGTPGCGSLEQIGFTAGAGYDLASGLGAVDAQALVTQWAKPQATGTGPVNVTNTITASQTINPSGSLVLSAIVTSGNGGPAPTGNVAFFDQSTSSDVATVALVAGSGESSTASTTVTGVLTQGGHPIVAEYGGNDIYAAANSQPVVVEVQPSSTTTVVTPATSTPAPGSTLAVTAVINSLNAGAGASPPGGTVNFMLDGISQGVEAVVPGTPSTSSITMTMPYIAGTHQIVGFYSGDNNYTNSTSTSASVTIPTSAPTVALTPSTATPQAGGTFSLTATITPPYTGATPPSGTVTFLLDGASVGTGLVVAGSPSTSKITLSAPSIGTHTVLATYNGDSNYSSATSPAVTITVATTPTTLLLSPSTTTPTAGASMLLTATVSATIAGSAVPTGVVTFTLDGTIQGTAPVVSGSTANLTIVAPATGSHTLQATYSGDSNYASSSSPVVSITVAKTTTTVVVTPATTTPAVGSSLAVTASIVPTISGATQPSGTVTFTLDGVSAGVAAVVQGSPSTATVTLPSLTPGTHLLIGTYSGDTYYAASTSVTVTITVAKSPTAIIVTPATLTPTAGGSLLVTAAITATTYGTTLPSGTVTVLLDGVAVGVGTVVTGSPSTATITIPVVSAGSHVVTATYSGDTYYAASTTSTGISLLVAKGATATTVTATPSTLAAGITETLTATIAPVNAVAGTVYTITGTVNFYDGSTLLGTAVVSSDVATLTGVALADNLNHTVTAIYSGDANWSPSVSSALLLAATTLPDYVVLTSNYSTAQPGQVVVLTATVTPNSTPATTGEQNATGSGIFYDGTMILGEASLAAVALTDTSTATLTLATLPGGQDAVFAVYQGDLYYDEATSNLLTLDIEEFTITPDPSNPATNLNIVQGSAGTAIYDITGLGGFNSAIQVVCAVPTQDDMTCTASPQQVVPNGTVTFVVQTFTAGNSTTAELRGHRTLWPRAAGGAALAVLGFFLLPFGRRARIFTDRGRRRFMILVLLLVGLGGVGMGCNSVTKLSAAGTPLGVATLKITGSANVDNTVYSHSVYLTVNVLVNPAVSN